MLLHAGRWQEATEVFEELHREHPGDVEYHGLLGVLEARQGNGERAETIAAELEALDRPYLFGENTYARACIAAVLGERELAMQLLRDAISQGSRRVMWLHREPDLEPMHGYPPFEELLRPKG